LILWVDEISLFNDLPATLRRLQDRGVEVRLCRNYRSHKKYYPYVESQDSFGLPLVTADDDIIYPKFWLKLLVEANQQFPDVVNCYFAGDVEFERDTGELSVKWKSCHSTDASFCHHPLGGTGVIYPPKYLRALKCAGAGFESCCPTQDDIWHHVIALRAGFKVRQILPLPPYFAFQSIPGTRRSALNGEGKNWQISASYTDSEIEKLRISYSATTRGGIA
jgi:hypothetical protein